MSITVCRNNVDIGYTLDILSETRDGIAQSVQYQAMG
jgi:hypothetical protein